MSVHELLKCVITIPKLNLDLKSAHNVFIAPNALLHIIFATGTLSHVVDS
jgi:hypothetical protein